MSYRHLANYAVTDAVSRGRMVAEEAPSHRTEFLRDRDRIIHSSAFRRLEYKTQVFVNHEGDMFRTRLTHSMEVAQIGRAVSRALEINEDLTEAISLAHDLGHTPFGHAGQEALNHCMEDYGGFEHNYQSLRVVDELEERYAEFDGLNLMYETREGILKHCSRERAKTLGSVGERFLNGQQPTLEAQVANIADAIAYNNHDVDDGLRAGFITLEQLCEVSLYQEQHREVIAAYPKLEGRRLVHEIVRRVIGLQVADLIDASLETLRVAQPDTLDAVRNHGSPMVLFSHTMSEQHQQLKTFLRQNVYTHYRVHRMMEKAKQVIRDLFAAFFNDPRLLPPNHQESLQRLEQDNGAAGRARAVADYIAGMTDRFALLEYRRIYDPQELT